MRPIVLLAILFTLSVSTAIADKKEAVAIRGEITVLSKNDVDQQKKGNLGSIRVEGKKEADTEHDKAQVRVTKDTKIEKLAGKERKPAEFDDLKKGVKMQATFVGPVAESYPVMATAGTILILE